LTVLFSLSLIFSAVAAPVAAGAPPEDEIPPQAAPFDDNLSSPLADAQNAARQEALQLLLQGKVEPVGANQVVEVGTPRASLHHGDGGGGSNEVRQKRRHQFVELDRSGEDLIWTVLGEFGAGVATHHGGHPGPAGPAHNEIAEPNRRFDNSTIWVRNFSEEYYEDLLFSGRRGAVSMRNYYIEQSSGAYAVDGDVTDWVRVPNNAASYGSNYCGSNVCADTWRFVQDSVNAWYSRERMGMSEADVNAYLAQYDVWDRYDSDGDGNFDECDGYIDHFQSIHAGEGEETGGGAQGTDAIWSHRWYVQLTAIGAGGPTDCEGDPVPFGGTRVGMSPFWIGDYTIEPENGGVGVFAHEFGHDLGLPDLYDTFAGENSTGFWTLMSSGSYGNSGRPRDGLGTKPVHMGLWEKFQIAGFGWINPGVFESTESTSFRLGPSMHQTKNGLQGAFVLLPDKQVDQAVGDPPEGNSAYYSTAANNLNTSMTTTLNLPAAAAIGLSFQAWYHIENCWDYAYVEVSTDAGLTFTPIQTSVSTTANQNSQNDGFGITGTSGDPTAVGGVNCDVFGTPSWVPVTADLTPYAGQTIQLRVRYETDVAVVGLGFEFDDVEVVADAVTVFADGAETSPGPWTMAGFVVTDGVETGSFFNAYVLEYRQYNGYDQSLKTGPYNFGFLDDPDRQNWVEHFPYQDGLLISYWDDSQTDNNTSEHPGEGLILPVDAHPAPMYDANGNPWRARIQSYDSTFGSQKTDKIKLHQMSEQSIHYSQNGVKLFDDTLNYWSSVIPLSSVKVPNTGTQIRVPNTSGFYAWVYLNQ
jgi:immune inhibitor A